MNLIWLQKITKYKKTINKKQAELYNINCTTPPVKKLQFFLKINFQPVLQHP